MGSELAGGSLCRPCLQHGLFHRQSQSEQLEAAYPRRWKRSQLAAQRLERRLQKTRMTAPRHRPASRRERRHEQQLPLRLLSLASPVVVLLWRRRLLRRLQKWQLILKLRSLPTAERGHRGVSKPLAHVSPFAWIGPPDSVGVLALVQGAAS